MTMNASRMTMLPGVRATTSRRVWSSSPMRRSFSASLPARNVVGSALPAKKPVGAFRGGLFGFLAGTVAASAAVYSYILKEYRVSNEMLTEDIDALQSATLKLQTYIGELETKVDQLQKKK